ncbi:hypothetical protein PCL_05248 [Purpureocillium lilacinum]|uniref:Uncharacterized protein n=1 Tax=Purpureocillium lilacinum TaxID=33203 RepID=A0A2U3DVK9_PURLI|nr:hypothetical protein PCL_05248 [Purpureocillium lilacinum]
MCAGTMCIKKKANERAEGSKMARTPSFPRLEAKEDVVCGAKRVGKGEDSRSWSAKHRDGDGKVRKLRGPSTELEGEKVGEVGERRKERKGRKEGGGRGEQVLYAGKEDLNSWLPGSDLRGSWQQHVTPCLSVHASLQILFISSDGGRGK